MKPGLQLVECSIGDIEVIVDHPQSPELKGLALIAHPQPLMGGSAQHKIPNFLAKAFAEDGWLVVRPNFRGVGGSTGEHDHGIGESHDLLDIVKLFRPKVGNLPLCLVGFSFGAFVQARVADMLIKSGEPAEKLCLAGMPFGQVQTGRVFDTPQELGDALVIHGELDEIVPLKSILEWASPSSQVISVVPGADHFFTGRLPILRKLILNHVSSSK